MESKKIKLGFKEDERVTKAISKLSFDKPQPLEDLYWAIEDSYEYTLPVVLSYVKPDSTTWGNMGYYYAKNQKVGFGVNTFISSWSISGYNIIQKEKIRVSQESLMLARTAISGWTSDTAMRSGCTISMMNQF